MSETNSYVRLPDPTGIVRTKKGKMAKRLNSLDGKVMGVIDDAMVNAHVLLDTLADEIQKNYKIKERVSIIKGNWSASLPDDIYTDLRKRVDFVIIGVGVCGGCTLGSVADGVQFELDGIPSVTVVEDLFQPLAATKKELMGLAEYEPIIINYPMGNDQQAAAKGKAIMAQVVSVLTGIAPRPQPGGTAPSATT
jgi:hypothetical protein